MIQKLVQQNWGKASALLGLMVFAGLAFMPLVQKSFASGETKPQKEKDGWLASGFKKNGEDKSKNKAPEIKALTTLNGQTFLASKMGFYQIINGKAEPSPLLQNEEIKAIGQLSSSEAWVATKMGLYLFNGKTANRIYAGEVKSASRDTAGVWIVATKEMGLQRSDDGGKNWKPASWDLTLLAAEHGKKEHHGDYAKKD